MAVARLVCGDCGGELALSDVRCPSCGASIEREGSAPGKESRTPPAGGAALQEAACRACGQLNPVGTEFCGSCGARLSAPSQRKAQKPAKHAKAGPVAAKKKFDVWQIASLLAVIALLGYLAYWKIEEGKGSAQSSESSSSVQGNASFSGIKPQTVDLTPLEDAVRERPADAGAQLRLANALEDNKAFSRAVNEYKKYLTMRPKDPDARTDLGICYFQMALADSVNRGTLLRDAAAEMELAFNNAPRPHQPSAFNLGVVFLHLDQAGVADRWFKKAVEINRESDLGKRAQSMIAQHNIPQ